MIIVNPSIKGSIKFEMFAYGKDEDILFFISVPKIVDC